MRFAAKRGLLTSIAVLTIMAPMAPALAQPSEDKGTGSAQPDAAIGDIIVTAQKRAQTVQDVPLSITVLSGDQIEREGIRSFQNYAARVPNLAFSKAGSSLGATGATISLRGIYGGGTTGFYLDETALPASLDPQVVDLERIEVLRGPQGTLYGARSMGGTVRLITRQPDVKDVSGSAHAILSATRRGGANGTVDGAVNIPLVTDRLAVRAFGFWDYQSGVFTRVPAADAPVQFRRRENIGSTRRYGGAIAARLQLFDDALSIVPRAVVQRARTNAQPYADIAADNFVQKRLFDLDDSGTDKWNLFSLTGRYAFSFGELVSATSQFNRDVADRENASEVVSTLVGFNTPSLFPGSTHGRTFSQELRFASEFKGPFQITLGVIYQRSTNRTALPPIIVETLGDIYHYGSRSRGSERSAYGEANLNVTDRLQLIAGLRYFRSRLNVIVDQGGLLVGPVAGAFRAVQSENGLNPRFGIKYRVGRDLNFFVNAAKGFRTGGANPYPEGLCRADREKLGISAQDAASYESDSVWSYEAGVKSSLAGGRLTLNATAFRIDWSDIQQSVALACGFSIVQNGGKARSEGFELEVQASPVQGLILAAGVGYTNARITDAGEYGVLKPGSRIQQVPRWNFTASSDYKFSLVEIPLTLHGDFTYVGSSVSRSNILNGRIRPSYKLTNLRLGTDFDRFNVNIFIENIFDEIANLADVPPLAAEDPNRPRIAAGRPRTIGIDLRAKF